jgi:hypothetical protein
MSFGFGSLRYRGIRTPADLRYVGIEEKNEEDEDEVDDVDEIGDHERVGSAIDEEEEVVQRGESYFGHRNRTSAAGSIAAGAGAGAAQHVRHVVISGKVTAYTSSTSPAGSVISGSVTAQPSSSTAPSETSEGYDVNFAGSAESTSAATSDTDTVDFTHDPVETEPVDTAPVGQGQVGQGDQATESQTGNIVVPQTPLQPLPQLQAQAQPQPQPQPTREPVGGRFEPPPPQQQPQQQQVPFQGEQEVAEDRILIVTAWNAVGKAVRGLPFGIRCGLLAFLGLLGHAVIVSWLIHLPLVVGRYSLRLFT